MSTEWILYKLPEFARDFLRDFCLASEVLEKEFLFVDNDAHVHHKIITELIGTGMRKGMIRRLHDTSRYFFRNDNKDCPIGQCLDWCIAYLVHEIIKLQESSYQIDVCSADFIDLQARNLSDCMQKQMAELRPLIEQSKENMRLETTRTRFILRQCRQMIPPYFRTHQKNALLARFLVERNELVRNAFRDEYQNLIDGIYGKDSNEYMYILAASSLRKGGWLQEAHRVLEKAGAINPNSPELAAEREQLASVPWKEQMYDRR